jgi:hydrogenase maturation factor
VSEHCDDAHCITCADEARTMTVVSEADDGIALCAEGAGAPTEVLTDLVGPVQVGDSLLVHAGVALGRLT